MRRSDLLRYGLWATVLGTALRNRREYGVPTAWLTHLAGNTLTLLLPDLLQLLRKLPLEVPADIGPILRTIDRRVRQDPHYAGYVAPLAIGFIASHPDYSIYHGRWAERTLFGFGVDSFPHATAAYGLARFVSETALTLHAETPSSNVISPLSSWSARHVDGLAVTTVLIVTLLWEISEYLAHHAEIEATGRDASEVNMQWSMLDAVTDSISNLLGLAAAIQVRHSDEG